MRRVIGRITRRFGQLLATRMSSIVRLTPAGSVTFRRRSLHPAVREYLTQDDIIHIAGLSRASPEVHFRFRFQKPNGAIVVFEELLDLDVSTIVERDVRLGEGFLLSCTAQLTDEIRQRGQVWVQVEIRTGRAEDTTPTRVLISDYVQGRYAPSWPDGTLQPPCDGRGELVTPTLNDPAAGANYNLVTEQNVCRRLITMSADFVTDATAANRRVSILLDDGANRLYFGSAEDTQPANTTRQYTFAAGVGDFLRHGTATVIPTPIGILLRTTDRIRTSVAAIQAGDQWTNGTIMIEDWADPRV